MNPEKATILVIDDEIVNIKLIGEALKGEHEILFACDGERGIALAMERLPDLIILDIVMPGEDGYAVCARLKADPSTASIPVIFVTALGATEQEVRGLEAGAVDYITKPVNPPVARVRVRNHLELVRARRLLENLASTDGLTGLANRRSFDERLREEHARLRRSGGPLSVIMIDIDHFKAFNDTYGHPAGDSCLAKVAAVVRGFARRPGDVAARYGGEEFVCLLPGASHDDALKMAEAMREHIAGLAIPHLASTAAQHVTASLGVATASCTADADAAWLLECADRMLYQSKISGRNRCSGTFARRAGPQE